MNHITMKLRILTRQSPKHRTHKPPRIIPSKGQPSINPRSMLPLGDPTQVFSNFLQGIHQVVSNMYPFNLLLHPNPPDPCFRLKKQYKQKPPPNDSSDSPPPPPDGIDRRVGHHAAHVEDHHLRASSAVGGAPVTGGWMAREGGCRPQISARPGGVPGGVPGRPKFGRTLCDVFCVVSGSGSLWRV